MYTAETLSGNTNIYFNDELLLKCVVYKYLFRDAFHVETIDGTKILEIKIKHFLGFRKKHEILNQKLSKEIKIHHVKGKPCVKVGKSTISFRKKTKAWKFEGDFMINNNVAGSVPNSLSLFKSSFNFNFTKGNDLINFCLILFSIMIIDEFNSRPPVN